MVHCTLYAAEQLVKHTAHVTRHYKRWTMEDVLFIVKQVFKPSHWHWNPRFTTQYFFTMPIWLKHDWAWHVLAHMLTWTAPFSVPAACPASIWVQTAIVHLTVSITVLFSWIQVLILCSTRHWSLVNQKRRIYLLALFYNSELELHIVLVLLGLWLSEFFLDIRIRLCFSFFGVRSRFSTTMTSPIIAIGFR